jgi:hypothetical protein
VISDPYEAPEQLEIRVNSSTQTTAKRSLVPNYQIAGKFD